LSIDVYGTWISDYYDDGADDDIPTTKKGNFILE
jgi:hypothetical protein